ncbi:hypothetical protein FUAX_52420 (plasmid) [Fulvitalea axinellae]|uniref:Uncharacterized protein n=1 Tax=Fulvitalea axinellae TaxID=1182444 RepID=A0AAU9DJW5_9BACT|nr:hypothetical protein FUAX_52420 [Fulvitalea axinellae]
MKEPSGSLGLSSLHAITVAILTFVAFIAFFNLETALAAGILSGNLFYIFRRHSKKKRPYPIKK